jgi:hypothetical protein
MRISIKILAAVTVLFWTVVIVFPLATYHLGFYGGATASMAGICAVIESYHSEEVVRTRGGKIHKKDSRIGYLIPHLVLGFFLACLMLAFVLGSLFEST